MSFKILIIFLILLRPWKETIYLILVVQIYKILGNIKLEISKFNKKKEISKFLEFFKVLPKKVFSYNLCYSFSA